MDIGKIKSISNLFFGNMILLILFFISLITVVRNQTKIRKSIIDYFLNKYRSVYKPGCNLSFNEGIIPCK